MLARKITSRACGKGFFWVTKRKEENGSRDRKWSPRIKDTTPRHSDEDQGGSKRKKKKKSVLTPRSKKKKRLEQP